MEAHEFEELVAEHPGPQLVEIDELPVGAEDAADEVAPLVQWRARAIPGRTAGRRGPSIA